MMSETQGSNLAGYASPRFDPVAESWRIEVDGLWVVGDDGDPLGFDHFSGVVADVDARNAALRPDGGWRV